MSLLLYAITAALLVLLVRRLIAPLSTITALVLFLIPFCLTGRALLTDGVYAPVDLTYFTEPLARMRVPLGVPEVLNSTLSDLYAQMIPWRAAVRDSVRHGEWPIWNRFMLSGTVLAPAAQAAAYSPFTLLACILPVAKGLTFSATLSFFIAALGAFLFARELGCRDSAALIAAAGFAFSTPLAFFILWAIGVSWSFFPFVLLGTRRCVREPSLRSAAILTAAFTFLLLSGHPETSLHVVFLGAIYGVFELALRRRELVRPIVIAVCAGVVALLLCAIYVLPIMEAAPQTMEHQFREGTWANEVRGGAPAAVHARLLTDFFPMLHGQHFTRDNVGYLPLDASAAGSVLLALALYGIATGTAPLQYQWYLGTKGVITSPVAGATGSSLTITPAVTSSYWVRISNGCTPSVDSDAAVITVNNCPAVTINTLSPNANIIEGTTTTLFVGANGGTLSYQWYSGATGSTASPIVNARGATLDVHPTSTSTYWVMVSNDCGASAPSDTIAIVVTPCTAPRILVQPTGGDVVSGGVATLFVGNSGTAPLTYNWYEGESGDTSWPIGNASGPTASLGGITTSSSYWVRISNACGTVDSAAARVNVVANCSAPVITQQPQSTTIGIGGSTVLTVGATGASLTYQWYAGQVFDFTSPIGGSAAAVITPPVTSASSFWVRIVSPCGTVNSAAAVVTPGVPPKRRTASH